MWGKDVFGNMSLTAQTHRPPCDSRSGLNSSNLSKVLPSSNTIIGLIVVVFGSGSCTQSISGGYITPSTTVTEQVRSTLVPKVGDCCGTITTTGSGVSENIQHQYYNR